MTPKRVKSNKIPGSIKFKDTSPEASESPKEKSPDSITTPKGTKSLFSDKSPKGTKSPGSGKSPKGTKSPCFSKSPTEIKLSDSSKSPKSNLENHPPASVRHAQFGTQDDNFIENSKAVRPKIPFHMDPLNLEVSNISQSEVNLTRSGIQKNPLVKFDKSPEKRFSESSLGNLEKKARKLNDQEISQLIESLEPKLPQDSCNSHHQKQPLDSSVTNDPSGINSRSRSGNSSISFASQIHDQNFPRLSESSKDLTDLEMPEFLNKIKNLKISEFQKVKEEDNFPEIPSVSELSKRIPENFLNADFPSSEEHSKSIKSKLLFYPNVKVTEDHQAMIAEDRQAMVTEDRQAMAAEAIHQIRANEVANQGSAAEISKETRVAEDPHHVTSVDDSPEDMEKDVPFENMEE